MLCQYNNIYADSYKYLKEKKVQTEDSYKYLKENKEQTEDTKKKKNETTVATVPLEL